jgi:hypothetical protein
MTSAKPQQMTGQKSDPDDLIAELTKLMASEGRNLPATRRDPVVVHNSEPPVWSGGPQTVRIPGVTQPVVAAPRSDNSSNASLTPAPEPLANWKDRLGGASATPASSNAVANRREPMIGADAWRSSVANVGAESPASPSGFEFDFGFNRRPPDGPTSPTTATKVIAPTPAAPQPTHDVIAELIAAELDSALPAATPQPATVNAAPTQTAAPMALAVVPREDARPAQGLAVPLQAPRPVAPRRAPESDRFVTAPVFGLGSRPADEALAAKAERDPIDEIESLIGEAVRVELSAPPPLARVHEPAVVVRRAEPEALPVVPPPSAQFAPRKTSLGEPALDFGVDAAILEAAAVSGAEVGRIEAPHADEAPAPARRQSRRSRRVREERPSDGALRNFVIPVIAGTILVAIGFGLFWAFNPGGRHTGVAPILSASLTPAKTIPLKPADVAPHSVVMQELSGTSPAPSQETLQSRDQTAGDNVAQITAAATAPATKPDGGLANRKVRTVTVRPDGTIISGEDTVAGSAELPVSRPNVPALPGVSAAEASDALPGVAKSSSFSAATMPAATVAALPVATPAPTPAAPPAATQIASVAPASVASLSDSPAPLPMARDMRPQESRASLPATLPDQPASAVNAQIKPATTAKGKPLDLIGSLAASADAQTPAPASAGAVETSSTTAGAVAHVQLSSQPTEAAAEATAASLQRRFGSLFNGAHLSIIHVDLGSKGVRYRVVMPAGSLADARQLCTSIKSNGGDCIAGNG